MSIEIVPPARWREFLDSFNRVHRGWLVNVEASNRPGILMCDVPLGSIQLDEGNIVIDTGRGRDHTDHVVAKPATMCVERTPDGADKQLEIVSRDGRTVRVRFRTAIRPELVDGIAGPDHP
jgi:hypothetical protein